MMLMKVFLLQSDYCHIKFIERKKKFLNDKSKLYPNNMIVGACIVSYVIYDCVSTKDCDFIYHVLSLRIEKYNDYSRACVYNSLDDVNDK